MKLLPTITAALTSIALLSPVAIAQTRFTGDELLFLDYVADAGLEVESDSERNFYVLMGHAHCAGIERGQPIAPYIRSASRTDGIGAIVPAAFKYLCPQFEGVLPESLRVGQR